MPSAASPDSPTPPVVAAGRGPLAVRLCNWVGEVVLALPTLRRLAAAGYELELVGKRWAVALLEGAPWPVSVRPAGLMPAIGQMRQLRAARAGGAAPPAFLLTKSFSSAVEARLGGWRPVGYARDARSWLLATAVPLPRFAHASHAYWHLASAFLGTEAPYPTAVELRPSATQLQRADALLNAHALASQPFVVLCPFSGADDRERAKVWPGFAELGRLLAARGTLTVVCPGPGEEARAAEQLPLSVCLRGLDLGLYAGLLARAAAVVANDTGPGHVAAAVGAPLIAVFGPRSVAAWAPLGTRVTLLQQRAGWPTVAVVAAALPR
jgi:lipopolysaccharide heptosyltransferase II